jgi:integrase
MLMLDTGLRVGEALALEWRDVRLSLRGNLHPGAGRQKSYARRSVPLTCRFRMMLEARRKAARSFHVFAETPAAQ